MAKRNKNKLKKRKQRQLKKAFKHSENHSEKQSGNHTQKVELEAQNLLLENDYLPPYKEPKENTSKKHEARNKAYQRALNKVYGGTVIPLDNYSNSKSIILHTCTECNKEFYSRPGWLLTKENQKHICGVDTGKNEVKQKRKEISETEKLDLLELFKAGMSIPKLVKHFDISRYRVNKYLKEAGVK